MARYEEIAAEWYGIEGNHEKLDTLKEMELSRLDRIAEVLEDINDNLSDLSEAMRCAADILDRCENVGPRGSGIVIHGMVDVL